MVPTEDERVCPTVVFSEARCPQNTDRRLYFRWRQKCRAVGARVYDSRVDTMTTMPGGVYGRPSKDILYPGMNEQWETGATLEVQCS